MSITIQIEKKIYDSNFKIITYEEIKGVWDSRIYPIILFSTNFKKTLSEADYDEVYTYQILGQLHDKKSDLLNTGNTFHNISRLSKIFSDLGKDEEVECLLSVVDAQSKEDLENPKNTNYKRMEVHVAAILYKGDKILVFKHKDRGWEFGGIHIKDQATSWKDEIEQGYSDRYNVKISVEEQPVPITVYNYESQKRRATAFGIVVLGELINSESEILELTIPQDYEKIYLANMEDIKKCRMIMKKR